MEEDTDLSWCTLARLPTMIIIPQNVMLRISKTQFSHDSWMRRDPSFQSKIASTEHSINGAFYIANINKHRYVHISLWNQNYWKENGLLLKAAKTSRCNDSAPHVLWNTHLHKTVLVYGRCVIYFKSNILKCQAVGLDDCCRSLPTENALTAIYTVRKIILTEVIHISLYMWLLTEGNFTCPDTFLLQQWNSSTN